MTSLWISRNPSRKRGANRSLTSGPSAILATEQGRGRASHKESEARRDGERDTIVDRSTSVINSRRLPGRLKLLRNALLIGEQCGGGCPTESGGG